MNNFLIVIVTLVSLQIVHGGPFHRRTRREVYPEIEPEKVEDVQPQVCVVGDLVYGADETVPSEQPCLKCRCQPPGVHCEATRCEKKPGCRAIHKPNTCCPDYQCECEHEGKTYANGERLEQKPGTECKVCYCRGGEVQCAEVSCYIRNDCEGRKVPGKCCPKYDHCPPKEPFPTYNQQEPINTSSSSSSSKEEPTPPETNEINEQETTTEILKVDKAVQTDSDQSENQKITIHEIIPEIKEIPITNSPKREIIDSVQGQLLVEEAQDLSTQNSQDENNELDLPDTESDSSEVAEIYQQPPPVLRIGDKLLFLKKGEFVSEKGVSTPATVITIIGAEGLQRGFEDSVENHEGNKTHDDELEVHQEAESTHILTLVTTTKSPEITETPTEIENPSTASPELTDDAYYTNSTIEIAVELPDPNKTEELDEDISTPSSTTESVHKMTTEANSDYAMKKSTTEKEDVQELNPEYPPIPDVMSPPDEDHHELEQSAKREVDMEVKILPEVLEMRNNNSVPQNVSNGEWLKSSLINTDAMIPESILREVADSDLQNESNEATVDPISNIDSFVSSTVISEKTQKAEELKTSPDLINEEKTLENVEEQEITMTQTPDNSEGRASLKSSDFNNQMRILLKSGNNQQEKVLSKSSEYEEKTRKPTENIHELQKVQTSQGSQGLFVPISTDSNEDKSETNQDQLMQKSYDIIETLRPLPTISKNDNNHENTETSIIDAENSKTSDSNEEDKSSFSESRKTISNNDEHLKTQSKTSENNKFGTTIEYTNNHIKALTVEEVEDIISSPTPIRLAESLEETTTDSGETVTDPSASSAALVNEDASVENVDINKSDFVEMLPGMENEAKSELDDSIETTNTTDNPDVEMIDVDLLRGHTDQTIKNATHEDNHPAKILSKRENDEDTNIFAELDREIGLVSGDINENKSKDEEEKEAQQIFKELLEENDSSTTARPSVQPRDRESAVLQRVSDAIAKFQLRDTKQSLDSSILGILRDFFSSQYRSYSKK